MIRWFWSLMMALALCLSAAGAGAQDTDPRHGLMWNRTGLPAVFPLQVKTTIGQDYFLTLHDVDTGDAMLAAYIKGGKFFRVLVPPGAYFVHLAYGVAWQGEDRLFGTGDKTRTATVEQPLTFRIKNFRTKGGHLLDLRHLAPGREARILTQPEDDCQALRLARADRVDAVQGLTAHALPETLTFYPDPLAAARAALALDLEEAREGRKPMRQDWMLQVRTRPC